MGTHREQPRKEVVRRIASLITSAHELDLHDASGHPTGFWADQVALPCDRFRSAGADVTIMTPDGAAPIADPYSLEPIFHHPAQDRA